MVMVAVDRLLAVTIPIRYMKFTYVYVYRMITIVIVYNLATVIASIIGAYMQPGTISTICFFNNAVGPWATHLQYAGSVYV